jgi:hypothetical protein
MDQAPTGIRMLPGSTDMLIVAPHAPIIDGEYQNDVRTGIIAEEIHRQLACATIINERYFKPKGEIKKSTRNYFLDLFRIDHSRKVGGYLDGIRQVVDADGPCLVVWVHGIADDVALAMGEEHRGLGLLEQAPESLGALVGYGQGGDPKTGATQPSLTARVETVAALCHQLSRQGMTTLPTHPEAWNYRGRDAKRLNQWCGQLGYGFDRAESLQLEIREKGFRDSEPNAIQAGQIVAEALDKTWR